MTHDYYSSAGRTEDNSEKPEQGFQPSRQTQQSLADEPELHLIHDLRRAYQTETSEDKRSLERVFAKLKADQTGATILFFPQVHQPETPTLQERFEPSEHNQQKGWPQRLGLLAAFLSLMLIVGGLLTVLNLVHANRPGSAAQIAATPPLSVPATPVVNGPAAKEFASAALVHSGKLTAGSLSTHVDNPFLVKQQILLAVVIPWQGQQGILTVKWYAGTQLHLSQSDTVRLLTPPGSPQMADVVLLYNASFDQPTEGHVEIYWNDQLAMTLFFVVEPAA